MELASQVIEQLGSLICPANRMTSSTAVAVKYLGRLGVVNVVRLVISADLTCGATIEFTRDSTPVAMKLLGNLTSGPIFIVKGHNFASFAWLELLVSSRRGILVLGHEDIPFLVRG